jgi:hypothetical protein
MSSFKRLNKADVTTVDYSANKRWNFTYSNVINDSYIISYKGKNEPFSIAGSTTTNNQYQSLIYSEINHLFYQAYTSSLNTGSLMFNVTTYESASSQRPTSSYFNYNVNPLLIKQFPTGAAETIVVLSVNQDIYGSKILPNSFAFSSSASLIKDDGYGNLYDISGPENDYIDLSYLTIAFINGYFDDATPGVGIQFVGNIFYAHGLAVLTNQSASYQNNTNSKLISFQNEHIIYENEVRCIVKESDYNLTYNPTLLKYGNQYIVPISGSPSNGYTTTGSFDNTTIKDFATGSIFQPYVTTIGLYNDNNELLMVAKLGKPIMLSPDTDMTFIVKYDT